MKNLKSIKYSVFQGLSMRSQGLPNFLYGPLLITYILLAFSTSDAMAQWQNGLNLDKRPSQYVIRNWDTEDGLSSESINALVQTPDGYIWVGTYTGLHRFDGKKFKVFNSQNSNLPTSNVLAMGLDSQGKLWLGTLHGIAVYDNGVINVPKPLEAVQGYSTETLQVTGSDELWFSTKSNHLYHYANGQLIDYTQPFGLAKSTVLSMAEGNDGAMYFGTDDSQLIKYTKDKVIELLEFADNVNGINKLNVLNGTVYIGTGKGLYELTDQGIQKSPILPNTAIMALMSEPRGILWLGTMRGLFRYDLNKNKLDSLTESSGLPNNIIRDILLDQRGNIWGGTYRSGVFFLSDGSITSYSKNDGLHTDIISSVTEITNGVFLMGNENGQLNLLKDGKISNYDPINKLPSARLKHLYTDSKQRVWVSTYAGLFLLDGEKSRSYTTSSGFPDDFVRNVFQDRAGQLWVGTKNSGLIRFKNLDEWEQLTTENGLTSDYIMSIGQNSKGQMVVGTISGINIIEDMEVVQTITVEDGLPSNFSFSTYSTEKYIWIASNDGLIGYSKGKVVVFNTENGMPFNIVYDVLADGAGNFWLPGEKAILKISIEELERQADLPNRFLTFEQFDRSNGMKNNHCLGGVLSYTDRKNGFWIPTLSGIVNIQPEAIGAPELYGTTIIEAIYADNQAVSLIEMAQVPANTNRLSIEFTGINYEQLEKIHFRYKLKPYDQHWVSSFGERMAHYTNLPPGQYEFELQAGINHQFIEPIAIKRIDIDSAWWQTIWARIFYVILAISIGFVIYWIRLKSLTSRNRWLATMIQRRTEELEQQKQELTKTLKELSEAKEQVIQSEKMASLGVLAAGVAHEINNPLNFIKSGSTILQKLINTTLEENSELMDEKNQSEIQLLMENIIIGADRIKQIVSSLSSFSRGTRDSYRHCNLQEVIENSLTILQHEYRNHITIVKNFQETPIMVWGNEGKLYQVFTNLFSNSIHAIEGTGQITIEVSYEGKMTKATIADNGKGIPKELISKVFDPFFTTKEIGKGTGLGLSIIYNIIKEHHGEISIESEQGVGTKVVIVLPTHPEAT